MKKNIFHIILSLLLTLAVTDYIWYDLLQDDKLAIELETESKEKTGEESIEDKLTESKEVDSDNHWPLHHASFSEKFSLHSGLVKRGNSFSPLSKFDSPKLFLLNCQLRIHC
ncbi:hypothetical protein [Fulvivirga lutea]|uniref:Uncharacterized protein n=1 Tax=Fulvivirga lutea TaxID=2810512 RepID=A0A974WMK7_9BACT|nr:hypothetical protein [Fulvivirga lutea]QSE98208.1 hypothetical protein JR347_03770 [Fulvivirga lutea]